MGLIPKLFLALSIVTTNPSYSSNYNEFLLDPNNQNKLCSASFPHREVEIKEKEAVRINFTMTEEEQNSNSKYKQQSFICIFYLKVPENMGVFGVIQKMSFRRDSRTNNCTDYIQFRHRPRHWVEKVLNMDLERKTELWNVDQVCGEISPLQQPFSEIPPLSNDVVARHSTLNRGNHLEVKVHISKKKLKPDEKVEIVVAFTPFRACTNDTAELKHCGDNTCILKSFLNDRVVNCPFVNCVDEDCTTALQVDPASPWSSKVALTAVSSIFMSFFLFLGCIMLCRYAEMFCWGGHPPDRGTELSQVEPTAPPHDNSSPDKDLPPAYETLFPERTSTPVNDSLRCYKPTPALRVADDEVLPGKSGVVIEFAHPASNPSIAVKFDLPSFFPEVCHWQELETHDAATDPGELIETRDFATRQWIDRNLMHRY